MAATDLIELYLTALRKRSYTDTTIEDYRSLLTIADRHLEYGIDRSNTKEIDDWIWREGLKPASRAAYHKALKGFHAWAQETGELDYNPMHGIPRPKVPRTMPRVAETDEVAYVVTQAPDPYRLWGILAAYGSHRCIEISRADRADFTEQTTTIRRGKGDKPRILATHPMIWEAVKDLPPGPITDRSAKAISVAFLQYRNRAQLSISLHRMRGWFCTHGYRATKDLIAMKENMGHADPATTAGYILLPDEDRRAPIAGLPTFGRNGVAGGVAPLFVAPGHIR